MRQTGCAAKLKVLVDRELPALHSSRPQDGGPQMEQVGATCKV